MEALALVYKKLTNKIITFEFIKTLAEEKKKKKAKKEGKKEVKREKRDKKEIKREPKAEQVKEAPAVPK